jgi:hypothetical protein
MHPLPVHEMIHVMLSVQKRGSRASSSESYLAVQRMAIRRRRSNIYGARLWQRMAAAIRVLYCCSSLATVCRVLVHVKSWRFRARSTNNSRRNTYCRRVRRQVAREHGARTDHSAIADGDVPQNRCTGPDQNTILDLWVSIPELGTSATQSHVMKQTDVISDSRGLADNHSGSVVYKYTIADSCCGVDVDL